MAAPSYISSPWDLDPIGDPIPPITIEEIDEDILAPASKNGAINCTCNRCGELSPCCGGTPDTCATTDETVIHLAKKEILKVLMKMRYLNKLHLEHPDNRNFRFTFYRGVFFYKYGTKWKKLNKTKGGKKRYILPGCLVQMIRRLYPEVSPDLYTNFQSETPSPDQAPNLD